MTLQKVIIRVAGETDLDSTISKLEKLGTVDKKNADSFKATSATAKASFKGIDNATTDTAKSMNGLGGAISAIGPALLAAFSVGAVVAFQKSILELTAKYDSLEKAIRFSSGTTTEANKNLEFLRETAEKLGLDFLTLTEGFKGFSVGATKAGISADQIRKIFGQVSLAASAMKLSASDTNSVFLALTQMISKGTVQAEELRGQLGERIPVAFGAAADAMGVTTRQLNKMLEQGQVISKDFLPKFADELEKTFKGALPEAAQSLQANINRMGNAFDQLKLSIGQSESEAFLGSMLLATRIMNDFTNIIKGEETELDGLAKLIKAIGEPLLKIIQLFSFGSTGGEKLNTSIKILNGLFTVLEKVIKLATLPLNFFVDTLTIVKDAITGAGFAKLNQDLKELGHTLTLGFFKGEQDKSVKNAIDAAKKKLQAEKDALIQAANLRAQAAKDAIEKDAMEVERLKKLQAEREKAAKKAEQARKAALAKELAELENQNQAKVNLLKQSFVNGEIAEKEYQDRLDIITIDGLEKQKAIYIKHKQDFSNITNQQLNIEVKNRQENLKEWAADDKFYSALSVKNKQDEENAKSEADYEYYQQESAREKQALEQKKANQQALQQFIATSLSQIASQINANIQARKQTEITAIQNTEQAELDALDRRAVAEQLTAQQIAKERKKIQDKAHKDENAIKKKAAQQEKELAIFQIAINTAVAAVKALPNYPLVALAIATGAVEAAIVASRPIPQFAKGVVDFQGKGTGTSDSNIVAISKGESIIKASETTKYKEELTALNKGRFSDLIYKKYITPALVSDSISDARNKGMAHNIASAMQMQELDTFTLEKAIKSNKKVFAKIDNLEDFAKIIQRSDHFGKYKSR